MNKIAIVLALAHAVTSAAFEGSLGLNEPGWVSCSSQHDKCGAGDMAMCKSCEVNCADASAALGGVRNSENKALRCKFEPFVGTAGQACLDALDACLDSRAEDVEACYYCINTCAELWSVYPYSWDLYGQYVTVCEDRSKAHCKSLA